METLPLIEAPPLADFESGDLIKFAIFAVIFILPALKSILEKAAKAGGQEPEQQRDEPEEEDVWGQLMRGETVIKVPPTSGSKRPIAPTVLVKPPAQAKLPGPKSSQAYPAKPVVRPSQRISVPYAQTQAEGPEALDVLRRSRTSSDEAPGLGFQESVAHIDDFRSGAEQFTGVSGDLSESFVRLEDRTVAAQSRGSQTLRVRHHDWRRAITLREVLGAPVALRSGDSDLPGLR